MKVLKYGRKSKKKDHYSFDDQASDIDEYCKFNNLNIIGGKKEIAKGDTIDRKSLQILLEIRREKNIKGIIVASVDRLSRNIDDFFELIDLAKKEGFVWYFADENLSSIDKDFDIEVLPHIQHAEREPLIMSRRIKSSFKAKNKNNEKLGGYDKYGFDSVNGKYVPNLNELYIMLYIATLKIRHKASFGKIAYALNIQKIPSKLGKKWYSMTVERVFNQWKKIHNLSNDVL